MYLVSGESGGTAGGGPQEKRRSTALGVPEVTGVGGQRDLGTACLCWWKVRGCRESLDSDRSPTAPGQPAQRPHPDGTQLALPTNQQAPPTDQLSPPTDQTASPTDQKAPPTKPDRSAWDLRDDRRLQLQAKQWRVSL